MIQREKEYLESYRKLNWTVLVVWLVIFLISLAFAFFLGYAWGEWIYPILSDLDFDGWLGIAIIVFSVIMLNILHHKAKKDAGGLW